MERKLKNVLFVGLFIIFSNSITAQVGVNNDMPEQALDVNGKIKLGDDATTPTEGTIRYNSATKTFEGFDGTL